MLVLSILKKLQKSNLVSEKIFRKLCNHGVSLAKIILDTMRNEGEEEMHRIIGLGGNFKTEV